MSSFGIILWTFAIFVQLWTESKTKTNFIENDVLATQPKDESPESNFIQNAGPKGGYASNSKKQFCYGTDLEPNEIEIPSKTENSDTFSKYLIPLTDYNGPSKVNPLEVWSLLDDTYTISSAKQKSFSGDFETIGLKSETAILLQNPFTVQRYTFRWPEGLLTVTYYGYPGQLSRRDIKTLMFIVDTVKGYVKEKLYKSKSVKGRTITHPERKDFSALYLNALCYFESNQVETPKNEIDLPKTVRRFMYGWPGNQLTFTFYGHHTKQKRDTATELLDVLYYTFYDIYLRIAVDKSMSEPSFY